MWCNVPEARIPGILDGSDLRRVEFPDVLPKFQGVLASDFGTGTTANGYTGTVARILIPMGQGCLITLH